MGTTVEINDTLQLTTKQGFPGVLDYKKHIKKPFRAEDFEGKIFKFRDKPKIRVYQAPPVRNFLAHNIDGKWQYWGLVHIIETKHDNVKQMTSGKFKIIYIYTPEEMKVANKFIEGK